jgi:hypothetical protein
MAIPNGVIFIWTGTHASIPAGWSRVLELDDRFPKGILDGTTNPNVTGGALTHSHTTTANHSHTMTDHTHAFAIGAHTLNAQPSGGGQAFAEASHNHGGSGTTGSASGGELQSIASSYSSVSNNPPYYEVIFITPATSAGGIPDLSLGLSDDTSFVNNSGKYNGYYNCDGNNSTPNLAYKYLLGASTGANAGATGGSVTNAHNLTHSHTVNSHTHSNASTAGSVNITGSNSTSSNKLKNHSHTVTFGSATVTINNDPALTTSESVEPAYSALLALQNRSGTVYTPVGIIGLWLGTIANIPTNFEIVSSMYDKHLKIGGIVGDIGVTGGSNTHSHTNSTHTHTGSSHTHTISGLEHTSVGTGGSSGGASSASADQATPHSSSMTAGGAIYSTETTSSDSVSNEPEYRTVAFIKYKGEKGGAFLFNFTR